MNKYKNNFNDRIVNIISYQAAGICDKTMGLTLVIYKYEDADYDYPLVMENKQFHKYFTKYE